MSSTLDVFELGRLLVEHPCNNVQDVVPRTRDGSTDAAKRHCRLAFYFRLALSSMLGCTALDDRAVTLHNGEECSSGRQCESLHCELAAETVGERELHICCSISCATGSACAPSGTSCVVCASGKCDGACEGDDCTMDEQPAIRTESDDSAPNESASDDSAPDETTSSQVSPVAPSALDGGTTSDTEAASSGGPATCGTSPTASFDVGNDTSSSGASTTGVGGDDSSSAQQSDATDIETNTAASSTATDESVPPEEVPECGEPLLVNGDFENEMQAWTEETNYVGLSQRVHPWVVSADDASVSPYDAVAQSGSYFAYVGGVPDDEDQGHYAGIVQSVVMPTDAVALWLRGYVWVSTEDQMDDEYDFGFIQVERSADDEQYRQFDFWTNLDASAGWVEFEAVLEDLGDLPGKRVRFLVGSITDEGGITRFWFDALRLEGICD